MHITARMTALVQTYVETHGGRPPARITIGSLFHYRWIREMNQLRQVPQDECDPLTLITEFLGIPVEVCLEPIGMWGEEFMRPRYPEPEPGSQFAPGFAARAGLL